LSARLQRVLATAIALLAALLLTSVLIRLSGRDPAHIYALLLRGTWANPYGVGQVLFKATPLLFTGLSVWLALRAGLFNVGAEGQITVGAFACAMCAAALPRWLPGPIAVPLCLLAALAGGAIVGAVPGWLKARRGAHEVITTIMINFVVRAAMVGIGALVFERESVHTRAIAPAAALARLSRFLPALRGSAVNLALPLALAVVGATAWALRRTRLGFHLRAVGAQPRVAAAVGVDVGRMALVAMTVSGALAGLGGANFVLGYKGYYEDGFSGGVGFVGIAVAVLGGTGPLTLVGAALLFGTLAQGALAVNAACPKEIIDVLQAVIIIAAAAASRVGARASTPASAAAAPTSNDRGAT
jgi:simple sugar transport system permease protein